MAVGAIDRLLYGTEVAAILASHREIEKSNLILRDEVKRASDDQSKAVSAALAGASHDVATAIRDEASETRTVLAASFAQLLQELNKHSADLSKILETLKEPERTKAREKQRDGTRAFWKGVQTGIDRWFQDAANDFQDAIKYDRYDYVSYWFLGVIYTLDQPDQTTAERELRNAAHYAWSEQPEESALSLLTLARWRWADDDLKEARQLALKAVVRAPNLAVANFDAARYSAQVAGCDEAEEYALRAIEIDPALFEPVVAEPALDECEALLRECNESYQLMMKNATNAIAEGSDLAERASSTQHHFRLDDDLAARIKDMAEHARRHGEELSGLPYKELLAIIADTKKSTAGLVLAVKESLKRYADRKEVESSEKGNVMFVTCASLSMYVGIPVFVGLIYMLIGVKECGVVFLLLGLIIGGGFGFLLAKPEYDKTKKAQAAVRDRNQALEALKEWD